MLRIGRRTFTRRKTRMRCWSSEDSRTERIGLSRLKTHRPQFCLRTGTAVELLYIPEKDPATVRAKRQEAIATFKIRRHMVAYQVCLCSRNGRRVQVEKSYRKSQVVRVLSVPTVAGRRESDGTRTHKFQS